MKKILKSIIKKFSKLFILFLNKLNAGRYFTDELVKNILIKKQKVKHKGLQLEFYTPNRLNYYRVSTFSTKEPETLEWIDNFKKDSVFWDIGANIGLYTCYAVKKTNAKAYSFEPSVFNLELLSKNIFLNAISDKVVVVSFPLNENLSIQPFYMSSTEWGGALSTFGKNIGHDGKAMNSIFQQKTVGMSIDNCIDILNFEKPNYIKIDVDGIEHLILKGATNTLKNAESILIEVNDNFKEQAKNIEKYLLSAGFKLIQKKYSTIKEQSKLFSSHHNQIWSR
tara:strand:+ start:449 stop:1291 length:843 start_codon:yes stop_codon:yes gene_type:complete